ncbi:MAG TPA: YHS domain-containing protein [Acidobacteriota bacterium]|nr:YHS domain-containing protein [Acidobacteriota bacterium]
MVTDPVCKMQVDEKNANYSYLYNGRIYYFCSVGCSVEFSRYPQDYAENTLKGKEGGSDRGSGSV